MSQTYQPLMFHHLEPAQAIFVRSSICLNTSLPMIPPCRR